MEEGLPEFNKIYSFGRGPLDGSWRPPQRNATTTDLYPIRTWTGNSKVLNFILSFLPSNVLLVPPIGQSQWKTRRQKNSLMGLETKWMMPNLMAKYKSRHTQRNKNQGTFQTLVMMRYTTDFNIPNGFKELFRNVILCFNITHLGRQPAINVLGYLKWLSLSHWLKKDTTLEQDGSFWGYS